VLLLLCGCGREQKVSQEVPDGWREFLGTWTAAGNRSVMQMSGSRRTSVATFKGSVALLESPRPSVGFRSEAIVFNDSATGLIGRAVWTDENGDQAFSELSGQGNAIKNEIKGTFVGGTGRYAGISGEYSFAWKFLTGDEDGVVQGRSTGLAGRMRFGSQ